MSVPPNPARGGYPPPLFHKDELDNYVPSSLRLVAAHIFVRHGERTPVRPRLPNSGIPPKWALCARNARTNAPILNPNLSPHTNATTSANDSPTVLSSTDSSMSDIPVHHVNQVPYEDKNGKHTHATYNLYNVCELGQMTDLGRMSTFRLGSAIRELYIDRLGLVPQTFDSVSSNSIVFRSTYIVRAINTLHQVIAGLYPAPHLSATPSFLVRDPSQEALLPNNTCSALVKLDKAVKEAAAAKYDPVLAKYDKLALSSLGSIIRINGSPQASGILDTLRSAYAHGFNSPKGFEPTDQVVKDMEEAVVEEWFSGFAHNRKHSRLASGYLIGDLLDTMRKTPNVDESVGSSATAVAIPESDLAKRSQWPVRLGLYACHDTSINGILCALGVFDYRWPTFTTHITFELFKSRSPQQQQQPQLEKPLSSSSSSSPSSGWFKFLFNQDESSEKDKLTDDTPTFVRLRYNGKTMKIPACKDSGKHFEGSEGEICTFEAFQDAVKDIELTYSGWRKECNEK